jgi:hypothetical protein
MLSEYLLPAGYGLHFIPLDKLNTSSLSHPAHQHLNQTQRRQYEDNHDHRKSRCLGKVGIVHRAQDGNGDQVPFSGNNKDYCANRRHTFDKGERQSRLERR